MNTRPLVLLADDDLDLLNAIRLRLENYDFEVVTAKDGYNALSLAKENKPDILILDVNMPAGDGFSVQQRLRENFPTLDIPAIYLTGDKSHRLDALAQQFGAIALFHKPFDMQELIKTVLSALKPKAA